ncbi:YoaK family protein [Pedobacter foliorum]
MGMQNTLVSMISGSVVRTTHLTGMFTDLGTDLSLAMIQRWKLTLRIKRSILLRAVIVSFFLLGGVMGTFLFLWYQFDEFLLPILLLIIALFYDYFRFYIIRLVRRYK